MSETLARHRITGEEWRAWVETGALDKKRVMLRHGEVVEMSPIGPEHTFHVTVAAETLYRRLQPGRWYIRVQDPIALGLDDEPQPDIVVAIARAHRYRHSHPAPPDVSLVIEVAQSSYRHDKASVADYAAAGIRNLWIVDLNRRRLEVFTDPDPHTKKYRNEQVFGPDDELTVSELELTLRVSEILPAED